MRVAEHKKKSANERISKKLGIKEGKWNKPEWILL